MRGGHTIKDESIFCSAQEMLNLNGSQDFSGSFDGEFPIRRKSFDSQFDGILVDDDIRNLTQPVVIGEKTNSLSDCSQVRTMDERLHASEKGREEGEGGLQSTCW